MKYPIDYIVSLKKIEKSWTVDSFLSFLKSDRTKFYPLLSPPTWGLTNWLMNSQAVQGSVVNSWATLNLPTSQRTWWLRRRPAGGKLGEFTKGFLEVLEKYVGSDFWGQERDSNIFLKMECLSDFQLESMYFTRFFKEFEQQKLRIELHFT